MIFANFFRRLSPLIFIFTMSCASLTPPAALDNRNDEAYRTAGVVRYFLPDLPQWAHRSEMSGCFRSAPSRTLDLDALRSSFQLSYIEALQFQRMYNEELRLLAPKSFKETLSVKEEEALFFRTLDGIRAGVYRFAVPAFPRIHLIHIDQAIEKPEALQRLRRLMESAKMNSGHPVFISFCKNGEEMDAFMTEHQFIDRNIRTISAEMLSPYGKDKLRPYTKILLSEIFSQDQKIHFFSPHQSSPFEIEGDYILEKY